MDMQAALTADALSLTFSAPQSGFNCPVCLENFPVAPNETPGHERVPVCDGGHSLCRQCATEWIKGQVLERQFVIPCFNSAMTGGDCTRQVPVRTTPSDPLGRRISRPWMSFPCAPLSLNQCVVVGLVDGVGPRLRPWNRFALQTQTSRRSMNASKRWRMTRTCATVQTQNALTGRRVPLQFYYFLPHSICSIYPFVKILPVITRQGNQRIRR